jgi:homoserine dehydrogenase
MEIAVLGYGTVGSGVVEVLNTNRQSIQKRAGEPINVKYVLDLRDFEGDAIQEKIVHDYDIILNDDSIGVVVEVMGGVEPAYTFVKGALQRGKSVCTSNKELVARHGAELLQIAKDNKVNFLFEASVGGGIPIIRPLHNCLTADEITDIKGILNGTTNYILSKMTNEGLEFDDVLKDAQEKGYAERNPEADVEGYDACRKIAILSSLAYGKQVDFEDIMTEGITKITSRDIAYAKALGAGIKLIGASRKVGDDIYAYVAPMLLPDTHPLIGVNDVFNAIFVKGNVLGDVMFYGQGAGKLPTASAVVADVVDAVKNWGTDIMASWSSQKQQLSDIKSATNQYFVRLKGEQREQVTAAFGEVAFVTLAEATDETAFVTDEMKESEFDTKLAALDGVINYIRAELAKKS